MKSVCKTPKYTRYGSLTILLLAALNCIGCGQSYESCQIGERLRCECEDGGIGIQKCIDGIAYSECSCDNSSDTGDSSIPVNDGVDMPFGGAGEGQHSIDWGQTGNNTGLDGMNEAGASTATAGRSGTSSQAGGNANTGGINGGSGRTDRSSDASGVGGSSGRGGSGGGASGVGGSSGRGGSGGGAGGVGGSSGRGGSGGAGGVGGSSGSSGSGGYEDYDYFCTSQPTSIPEPTQDCPTIVTTLVDENSSNPLTFLGKKVEIIIDETLDSSQKGPLVFYWHGLGGHPSEAFWGLGFESGYEIIGRGGMVVAMYASSTPTGTTIAPQWDTGHLDAADEVLACAVEQIGIDTCRIHSMGFSAGGLMTTQMSYRRSNYIASVVAYSGGIGTVISHPTSQDPDNKFAAMIVYGGSADTFAINFETYSINYLNDLIDSEHFAFICNHGQGHSVPDSIIAPAWQFLKDHPYGIKPSPYISGLPKQFPDYCTLQQGSAQE